MPSRQGTIRNSLLLLVGLAPLLCVGCANKTVQAAVPAPAPSPSDVRPMPVAPDTDANPPVEAQATAPTVPEPTESTPDLAEAPVVPPPRRPATAQSNNEETAEADTASRPEAPTVSPELSPSDQATYQRLTQEDSTVATKNLQAASGHQLNATQQDWAEKITSYLSQATSAGKDGDWLRAQNLAHKARSLSVQLMESL